MISSVLRSHFEDVGDMDSVCHSAVLSMKGVFGRSSFTRAEGEDSMFMYVALLCVFG